MSSSSNLKPIHSPAQASHPFPRLPLELRSLIWHAVAQQPRTLDIWRFPIGTLNFHASYPDGLPTAVQTYRFFTTRPVPAVLHVNRESRAIGLQYYVLSFGCVSDVDAHYGITMHTSPRTYVNWKFDTILLLGERDDNAVPDALADVLSAEGASIAIETSKVQYEEEWNDLSAIAENCGSVKDIVLYSDASMGSVHLDLDQLWQWRKTVELVNLEEDEEQRPELVLIKGRGRSGAPISAAGGKRRWGV